MITRTVVRSGGGGGSGSSLPSRVDYAYIVAKAKVGLDDAITGPTSFGIRFKVPASPGVIAGGLSVSEVGLEFTDGTNTAVYELELPAAGDDVVSSIQIDKVGDEYLMRVGEVSNG